MVAAVIAAGSEKAAAHRLGLSHSTVKRRLANARSMVGATTTAQLVWILAARLPEASSDGTYSARRALAARLRARQHAEQIDGLHVHERRSRRVARSR